MRGPDHYLAGEQHLSMAVDIALRGQAEEDIAAGQLYAAIAQAHFAAAAAAALAELDADEGPGGGSATGRSPEAGRAWAQVLVDDPDAELAGAGDVATCRQCGCTDDAPCDPPCRWATDDEIRTAGLEPMDGDLCTACLPVPAEPYAGRCLNCNGVLVHRNGRMEHREGGYLCPGPVQLAGRLEEAGDG